uniref:Coiled-coil domain-containing protein 25 n=1 Tax=Parastrongyloides trichosuri TaxID=131310 RepID=A0A0N4ZPA4_PARTI
MVRYFTSTTTNPPSLLYVGRDKEENELLIKWGWPEDIWFHVDKLSSAHVYVRLQEGQTMDDMSNELIEDCAALVKANSIQGCKLSSVDVVYTPWSNLKKTGDMVTGQVGFYSDKQVRKCKAEKRNDILNRLKKTEIVEESVDFRGQREARDAKEREKRKKQERERKSREEEERKRKEKEKEIKSYDKVFVEEKMNTNKDGYDSDDFM